MISLKPHHLLASLISCSCLTAAFIEYSGELLDHRDWHNPEVTKETRYYGADLDKDEVLGTAGYIMWGPGEQQELKFEVGQDVKSAIRRSKMPSWIQRVEVMEGVQVGRYPSYAEVTDPDNPEQKISVGTLIADGVGKKELVRITFGEDPPNIIRLGLLNDHLETPHYSSNGFWVTSEENEVGPIVTMNRKGEGNNIPDLYFFDVMHAKAGDSITISALPGPGKFGTLAALTLDAIHGHYYSDFRHPERYMKDFFVHKEDETYHLFYNIGKADSDQHWRTGGNEEMFAHAISTDLKNWEYLEPIMIGIPLSWEEGTISAPSIIKRDGKYWMAYTGFDRVANQRMGMAYSKDLYHWERYEGNPIDMEPKWSSWRPSGWAEFRDPHLLELDDGYVYAFNTTHAPQAPNAGAVSIARSKDMLNWEDLGYELAIKPGFHAAESPCAIVRNGWIYVFLSGNGHGVFRKRDIMAGEWEEVPFKWPEMGYWWTAVEIFEGPEGQDIFACFAWKLYGNMIRFWEMEWEDGLPRLKQ